MIIAFGVMVVVAIAISLPQLVATAEYLKLSYKWDGPGFTKFPHIVPYDAYLTHTLQWSDLATLLTGAAVSGDGNTLFVTLTGLVCIGLAVFGAWHNRRFLLVTLCATAIALFGLTLACASVPPFGWIYYHLPFINLVRTPSRGLFLFTFGATLLAAIGVSSVSYIIDRASFRWHGMLSVAIPAALVILCFVEIALWLPKQIGRPLSGPGVEFKAILDGPVVRDLLFRNRNGPLVHRFFADRSVVPPNIGRPLPTSVKGKHRR